MQGIENYYAPHGFHVNLNIVRAAIFLGRIIPEGVKKHSLHHRVGYR